LIFFWHIILPFLPNQEFKRQKHRNIAFCFLFAAEQMNKHIYAYLLVPS
jgi:hypothetical protein